MGNKDTININISNDTVTKLQSLSKSLSEHDDKIKKIQSTYRMYIVYRLFRKSAAMSIKEIESLTKKSLREITTEFRGLSKFKFFGKKVNNLRDGFGIIKWSSASKFVGLFINDKASGYGRLRHENYLYTGEFKNDNANGFGICIGPDKIRYEGIWREENLAGIGIEEFDKNRYEGDYFIGQKHGIGKYTWKDGSEYQGDWVNNSMQGWGIYNFSNGGLYMGEFSENTMSGYGEYILNNKTYIGMFLNDVRHGFGIDFLQDPIRVYVGFWKDGKKDGLGKMLSADSVSFCLYENGKKTKLIQNYSDAINLLAKDDIKYKKIFKLNMNKLLMIKNKD